MIYIPKCSVHNLNLSIGGKGTTHYYYCQKCDKDVEVVKIDIHPILNHIVKKNKKLLKKLSEEED